MVLMSHHDSLIHHPILSTQSPLTYPLISLPSPNQRQHAVLHAAVTIAHTDDLENPPLTQMLADSKLTSHHRLPLHLVHVFLILLTVLFLILGGVSGPETGYWWIQVTYADGVGMGGSSTGGSWSLGGLGACVAGEKLVEWRESLSIG